MSAAKLNSPTPFSYDNYRRFLEDALAYQKDQRGLSTRQASFQSGFKSPNYLQLVVNGKRSLNPTNISKLCETFNLNKQEKAFLEELISMEKKGFKGDCRAHLHKLANSKAFKKAQPERVKKIHYYSKWYYVAVRELVALEAFQDCPFWISKKLRRQLSPTDAKKVLSDLLDLGLLERGADGKIQQVQKSFSPDNRLINSAIVDFHKVMIQKGSQSLDDMSSSERYVTCVTIPVSGPIAEQMKMMIANFRSELLKLSAQCSDSDQVMQINIQAFPLTAELQNPKEGQDDE